MSAWAALGWGALATGALFIGQALAGPLERHYRLIGQVMAFGAGTLLSAVAYELIPEANLEHGAGVGLAFGAGALVFYLTDLIVEGGGGHARKNIAQEETGSGPAMFIGALLDGIPEAFILGVSLALGGAINVAFLVAVFVTNIPQGVAGTTSLRAAGYATRRITMMWGALVAASALVAVLGYRLALNDQAEGVYVEAFAAGAMLTMLSSSLMPEAFKHGGKSVGLVVALGYAVAAALSLAQ